MSFKISNFVSFPLKVKKMSVKQRKSAFSVYAHVRKKKFTFIVNVTHFYFFIKG
jgi:hypothetical protein